MTASLLDDGPTLGLVCILFLLCIVLSAVLPDRGSRRPIGDRGAHIANVRPIERPWDWSRDDDELRESDWRDDAWQRALEGERWWDDGNPDPAA